MPSTADAQYVSTASTDEDANDLRGHKKKRGKSELLEEDTGDCTFVEVIPNHLLYKKKFKGHLLSIIYSQIATLNHCFQLVERYGYKFPLYFKFFFFVWLHCDT